ncbi:EAL domain-containing protein [Terasakiella sp. SH-1]|uniref:EAL domain-containing protein n=1 Tax=Terasakiella sp. SH-1 TaxID=2560057 RepID=UPI0010736157|nr:EAL domain-containing protein [Terasakiella sp. SH-1]
MALSPEDFIKLVKEKVEEEGEDSVKQMYAVNLEYVVKQMGKDWTKVHKKAMFIAETIIKGNIALQDNVMRYSDGLSFVILFGTLPEDQAAAKMELITEQIGKKILGKDYAVNGKSGIQAGAINVEDLVQFEKKPIQKEELAGVPSDARNILLKKLAAAKKPEASEKDKILDSIDIVFFPIWDTKNEMVVGYRVKPKRMYLKNTLWGDRVLMGGSEDPLWSELKPMVIKKTYDNIQENFCPKTAYMVGVNVASFFNKHFVEALVKSVRNSPLTKTTIGFELHGLDQDFSPKMVDYVIEVLTKLGSHVTVIAGPDNDFTNICKRHNVSYNGLHLHRLLDSQLGRKYAYRTCSLFARQCRDANTRSFIWGVDRIDDLNMAIQAGFRYISGRAVKWETEAPVKAYMLTKKEVLMETSF